MINYVTGDATHPRGDGTKIIVHIVNDIGRWGAGFVLALSKRWPDADGPEACYLRWAKGELVSPFWGLGNVQFVGAESDIFVANLMGQRGTSRNIAGTPPVRYSAIREGLSEVAVFAKLNNASVHMPRIGCGLAGGDWKRVEAIIEDTLVANGIAVTVYDFQPS